MQSVKPEPNRTKFMRRRRDALRVMRSISPPFSWEAGSDCESDRRMWGTPLGRADCYVEFVVYIDWVRPQYSQWVCRWNYAQIGTEIKTTGRSCGRAFRAMLSVLDQMPGYIALMNARAGRR